MLKPTWGLALAFVLYASAAHAQYVPPIGIPQPPLDVLRARPALPAAVSVLPASIAAGQVVVLTGTVTGRAVACNGTATNWAWILGPARTTGEFSIAGQYCVVDGITGYMFHATGHDHLIRNSEFSGLPADRQMTGVGTNGSNIVFYRNKFHNFGDVAASFDQDAHGGGVSRGGHHVWWLENESYANSGDGINCNPYPYNASGLTAIHHIYIGRNKLHHNKQTGQWCKQSEDIIVSENESWEHHASNSSRGDCFGFQYSTNKIWYLKNYAHHCDVGFGVSEGFDSDAGRNTGAVYLGNTVSDIQGHGCGEGDWWGCAAIYLGGNGYSYVVNNTLGPNVIDGIHVFRGAGVYIAGTVGNTKEIIAGPDTGGYYTPKIPGVDLAAKFKALYGLDISSLTGSASPPPPIPPPPTEPPVVTPPKLPNCQGLSFPYLRYVLGLCVY